jgi:hypothetical protein
VSEKRGGARVCVIMVQRGTLLLEVVMSAGVRAIKRSSDRPVVGPAPDASGLTGQAGVSPPAAPGLAHGGGVYRSSSSRDVSQGALGGTVADTVLPALRRQTDRARSAEALSVGEAGQGLIRRCWWWCWGKKKYAQVPEDGVRSNVGQKAGPVSSQEVQLRVREPELSARDRFAQALLSGGLPASARVGAQRMIGIRALLSTMTPEQKQEISQDADLISAAEVFVGPPEYISLLCAVGMYTKPTSGNGVDYSLHMTACGVDRFIVDAIATKDLAHLRPYLQAAFRAGRNCAGYFAVVGDADWAKVYPEAFDDPVGGNAELRTYGFISAGHRDRVIILKNDRGTRSVAVHEAMHRFAREELFEVWGTGFNEGVTEYFTRLLTDRDGNPAHLGGPPNTSYQENWQFVCDLLPLLGHNLVTQQKALAQVYFIGNVRMLWKKFYEACIAMNVGPVAADERWDRFDAAISDARWRDAKDAMP